MKFGGNFFKMIFDLFVEYTQTMKILFCKFLLWQFSSVQCYVNTFKFRRLWLEGLMYSKIKSAFKPVVCETTKFWFPCRSEVTWVRTFLLLRLFALFRNVNMLLHCPHPGKAVQVPKNDYFLVTNYSDLKYYKQSRYSLKHKVRLSVPIGMNTWIRSAGIHISPLTTSCNIYSECYGE